jgi:hypothetical protein
MADDLAKRFPSDTPLQVVTPGTIVSVGGALFLKLDQTTPQTVSNGAPTFEGAGNDTPCIKFKSGTRIVFDA